MNIATKTLAQDPNDPYAGIKIIDVDTHFTEPHDFWTSRAPAKYKDLVPQLREVDGKRMWTIGTHSMGPACAASVVNPDGSKTLGTAFFTMEATDVHAGSSQIKPRLELMDQLGIHAQIVYGNIMGFGGHRGAQVDGALRLMSLQIYNEAMAEMQRESNDRFLPMALLPWWDIKLSLAEAERCHNWGMRGVNINSDPHEHGLPPLHDKYWHPLWEFCTHNGLSINFHIGASDTSGGFYNSAPWPGYPAESNLAISSTALFLSNARVVMNIIVSGMLDRFPDLKFVSVESGIGWIPFILEALEYQIRESDAKLSLTPKEYFQRQMYGCFWFERDDLVHTARQVGVDNVMFETDFPHPTCLYPDPIGYAREMVKGFTPEERVKVLSSNAAKLYRIDI